MSVASELLLRLWPVPSSCGEARHAVREFCEARSLAHLADDAELLTSELVTNAIRYGTSLITLLAIQQDVALVVTVTDDGKGTDDLQPALPEPMAVHGRGMFVVSALAGDWGKAEKRGGQTVWFRLP
jgi:anti-sigma regulatory factor (Ser/Thr protein kinase)